MKGRSTIHLLTLATITTCLLYSCSSEKGKKKDSFINEIFSSDFVDMEEFKTAIAPTLPPIHPQDSAFNVSLLQDIDLNVSYAYHLNNMEPIWFDANGIKESAGALTAKLDELWNEGLNPGTYRIGYIQQVLTNIKNDKEGRFPVDSIVQWDKAFTKAWLYAAKDLLLGSAPIQEKDSLWFAKNDTSFNGAAYLVNNIKDHEAFPALDSFRPAIEAYRQMKEAIAHWTKLKSDTGYLTLKKQLDATANDSILRLIIAKETGEQSNTEDTITNVIATYQYYNQLRATGKMDSATLARMSVQPDMYISSLRMNMERLRALPRDLGNEYVWVNIPLMEVSYRKDNAEQFHGRVVIGKKSRQTPTLWAQMANIVFNPPWGVPPTILKKDVGPGVSRSGAAYLSRKGLRAFDAKGRDMTAMVNGANYKRFSYRQPPGARNALGELKFNMPNKWDIYLHDTPHRENFSNRMRALSSGCVRVQNPKMLAEAILQDRNFTLEKMDTIIGTRKTKFEQIKRRLPVYIIYLSIAPDSTGNKLRYLEDIYGRDAAMDREI